MRPDAAADSRWQDPLVSIETQGTLPLEDFLTFRVNQLSNEFERQWTRFMRQKAGVSLSAWRVLANLQKGPTTFARVADATAVDKSLLSRSVKELEARALITARATEGDARSITLSLTPAGADLLDAVMPHAIERQRRLLGALSATERRAFYRAVSKLRSVALAWGEAGR